MGAAWEDVAPGAEPSAPAAPGDLLACHGTAFLDRLIATGERLHGAGEYAYATHIVCVADGHYVEALANGVDRTPLDWYQPSGYRLIRTGLDPADAARAVAFWESCVGDGYGYVTDVGLGLTCLSGLPWGVIRRGAYICSGLAAMGLFHAGVNFGPRAAPQLMMPSGVMRFYEVPPVGR